MNQRTLLVVDDEIELLASLNQYLSRVGYSVLPAASGAEALRIAVSSPPDMIISDIMMDEMDGFELQTRFHELYGHSIPFLFLTARTDLDDRLKGLRNGADDYIVKPFDPEELLARIEAILDRISITEKKTTREMLRKESRLLGRVSQELEVPASLLLQELESAKSQIEGDIDLNNITRYAKRLQQQIKELPWSDTEAPATTTVHLRRTRIAAVARGAAANAARTASQRQIRLKLTCGGLLSANLDPEAMRKAISDLLENAVQLAPERTQVELKARRAQDGGIEISILTADRETVDNASVLRPIKTAQAIVAAHGGRIEPEISQGSTSLVIWLPDNSGHQ